MRARRVTIRSEVVDEQESVDIRRGRIASSLGARIGCDTRAGLPERAAAHRGAVSGRSEEHTSELQSQSNLVCRLLLEKKKHVYMNISCSAHVATTDHKSTR